MSVISTNLFISQLQKNILAQLQGSFDCSQDLVARQAIAMDDAARAFAQAVGTPMQTMMAAKAQGVYDTITLQQQSVAAHQTAIIQRFTQTIATQLMHSMEVTFRHGLEVAETDLRSGPTHPDDDPVLNFEIESTGRISVSPAVCTDPDDCFDWQKEAISMAIDSDYGWNWGDVVAVSSMDIDIDHRIHQFIRIGGIFKDYKVDCGLTVTWRNPHDPNNHANLAQYVAQCAGYDDFLTFAIDCAAQTQ